MTQNQAFEIVRDEDLALYADFDSRNLGAGIERASVDVLPTVDLSPFFEDADEASRERAAQQLRRACIDVGFFYMKGHPFSREECDLLMSWGKRFFALPREEKKKWPFAPGRGFLDGAVGGDPNKPVDVKERLLFPPQWAMNEAEQQGAYPHDPYAWPADSVLPGFRAFIDDFNFKTIKAAQRIGWAISRSLGLDESHLERAQGRFGSAIVYNYYPPMDPTHIERAQWSFSPHSDFGSFNMLLQDSVNALQVRNAAGRWVDIPPVEGTLIVNIGNLTARATNDLYPSALHRVANTNGKERLSVSMFAGAPFSAVVKCLETCESATNPARYPPITAGDYVLALLKHANMNGTVAVAADNNRFR